jgi:hypothetical protein
MFIFSGTVSLVRPALSHASARSFGWKKTGKMLRDCSSVEKKMGSVHSPGSTPSAVRLSVS